MARSPVIQQPTPAKLRSAIERVRGLECDGASIDDLKDALVKVFVGWIKVEPIFDPGLRLFRGRVVGDSPRDHISRLSYPPPGVAPPGRANRAGDPVFYACTAREAVLFEVGATAGDRVAIAHFETTAPLMVMSIGYTNAVAEAQRSNRPVPAYGRLAEAKARSADKLVNDFLSELFTSSQPEKHYAATIAIAEKLLINPIAGGLLYPSVAVAAHSDNVALKPAWADANLRPTYVEVLDVTKADGSWERGVEIIDEARAVDADGSIRWLGHLGQWQVDSMESLLCEAVNGHWVARDSHGTIVDPT